MEMACGVHLGILLICLVQAEHARCWRVKQAQRRDSDRYVGFSQQDSNAQRLGYLQNRFRQPPVSAGLAHSSFTTQTVDNSGFTRVHSTSGSAQTVSQPAPDVYATYGLLQSSSGSEANGQLPRWRRGNGQKVPQAQLLDWLTPISSGSSISHFSGKKKIRQIQKDPQNPGARGSVQSSPTEDAFAPGLQPPAQRPHGAAAERPDYGQRGSFSKPFRAAASTGGQPLGCGLGRRVSSHRHYGSFKRAPQDERPRQNPSQRTAPQGHGFPSQGSTRPPTNTAFSCASYPPDWPNRQSAASYENPNRRGQLSSAPVSWTNTNPGQGVHNLVSGSRRRTESSAQRFAATTTFTIPQQLGGHAIRRLKRPADRRDTSLPKPQGHKVRWYRVKLLR